MEDQQALKQTAALHCFLLRCGRKVVLTCTRIHPVVPKPGIFASPSLPPSNSDGMFLSAGQMHWPTLSRQAWHVSLLYNPGLAAWILDCLLGSSFYLCHCLQGCKACSYTQKNKSINLTALCLLVGICSPKKDFNSLKSSFLAELTTFSSS